MNKTAELRIEPLTVTAALGNRLHPPPLRNGCKDQKIETYGFDRLCYVS